MTNKPLSSLSDVEIVELVNAKRDQQDWSIGLIVELEQRGMEILDLVPGLKSEVEAVVKKHNESLAKVLGPSLDALLEVQKNIAGSNAVKALTQISESFGASAGSKIFLALQDSFRGFKIDLPKYDFGTSLFRELGPVVKSEVLIQRPDLTNEPFTSAPVEAIEKNVSESLLGAISHSLKNLDHNTQKTALATAQTASNTKRDWFQITLFILAITSAITAIASTYAAFFRG